jgi:hypothetical protein
MGEWLYRSTFSWTPEPVWTTWRSENSWPYRDSNPDLSVVQPVASRYTDCTIPAHATDTESVVKQPTWRTRPEKIAWWESSYFAVFTKSRYRVSTAHHSFALGAYSKLYGVILNYCRDFRGLWFSNLMCHERCAYWSHLANCSIDSISNKTLLIILSYFLRSFILLFSVWKL